MESKKNMSPFKIVRLLVMVILVLGVYIAWPNLSSVQAWAFHASLAVGVSANPAAASISRVIPVGGGHCRCRRRASFTATSRT